MMIFLIGFLSSGVLALGVSSSVSYLPINEGEISCVTYDVFNSVDVDVEVGVSVHYGLAELSADIPDSILVPGNTAPGDGSVPVQICFTAPDDIFDDKCSPESSRKYEGYVLIIEKPGQGTGGSGSATSLGVSSPLTVDVICVAEEKTSYSNFYLLSVIIVIIIIIILLVVKRRNS